ncbi:MAG: phosphatase PAP2 family protein [Patescibacteria group bacterium]|nr:phosphatase PAP2 family protein [Patescibacteria group bacterium]MDE2116668.1 phosphatase PAP2 family protein [Patescibacteria group bacterium]
MDSRIIYAVQSIGPAWRPVADLLSYGIGYVPMFIAFAAALLLLRKHRIALELAVIFVVSALVTLALKLVFHAPRPFMVDPAVLKYGSDSDYGLPSMHAVMSVVILGWIVVRHPKSRLLLWGSIAIIILIGLSRVYLGVHYPSQVLAGWVVGILLLYLYYIAYKRLWSPFQKKLK